MDRLDYIDKWKEKAQGIKHKKEYWAKELECWSDWLWLGRHLLLKESGRLYNRPQDIIDGALAAEKRMLEKYKDNPDFNKYMTNGEPIKPDEEFGDTYWREINMNTGALRWLLDGEWHLDS